MGAGERIPPLTTFIESALLREEWPSRSWVFVRGFSSLYVRLTTRIVDGERLWPVLDLASIEARNPGQGAFTKLVAKLRNDYPHIHIVVEQAHERFGNFLVAKLGFTRLDPTIYGESYILKAKGRTWVPAAK